VKLTLVKKETPGTSRNAPGWSMQGSASEFLELLAFHDPIRRPISKDDADRVKVIAEVEARLRAKGAIL